MAWIADLALAWGQPYCTPQGILSPAVDMKCARALRKHSRPCIAPNGLASHTSGCKGRARYAGCSCLEQGRPSPVPLTRPYNVRIVIL